MPAERKYAKTPMTPKAMSATAIIERQTSGDISQCNLTSGSCFLCRAIVIEM